MHADELIAKGLAHAKSLTGSVVAQALLALDAKLRRNYVPYFWYQTICDQGRRKSVELIKLRAQRERDNAAIEHAIHLLCGYCASGNIVQDQVYHDIGGYRRRRCDAEPVYRFIREQYK